VSARRAFTTFYLSHSLGLLDALIGACALGRGATLLTFNSKHYRMIAGLVIEQPYSR
jgi:predicted nucleic acid-binding protein